VLWEWHGRRCELRQLSGVGGCGRGRGDSCVRVCEHECLCERGRHYAHDGPRRAAIKTLQWQQQGRCDTQANTCKLKSSHGSGCMAALRETRMGVLAQTTMGGGDGGVRVTGRCCAGAGVQVQGCVQGAVCRKQCARGGGCATSQPHLRNLRHIARAGRCRGRQTAGTQAAVGGCTRRMHDADTRKSHTQVVHASRTRKSYTQVAHAQSPLLTETAARRTQARRGGGRQE
jgi:hypothetical protein